MILLSLFHRSGVRVTLATEARADGDGDDAVLRVVHDGDVDGIRIRGSRAHIENVIAVIEDIRRDYPESDGWLEQENDGPLTYKGGLRDGIR
jgi:hypothetical protein